MRCPACNQPLALTDNVLVYRCNACGREYTPSAGCVGTVTLDPGDGLTVRNGDNFDFVEHRDGPVTVDDLRRLK